MIHVECNRGTFKATANRLSRHWYDVAMLFLSGSISSAIESKYLLTEVVQHKKMFFNESKARYENCLIGDFNLIPEGDQLSELRKDYESMVSSGMFYNEPFTFEELISHVKNLRDELSLT